MSAKHDFLEYFTVNLSAGFETVSIGETNLWTSPESPGVSVERKIMRGGPSDGVEVFTLSNPAISVCVMPTRGMGIWRVMVRQGEKMVRVGWESPVPLPVNPRNVPLDQPDGLGWLRGFNELVARCGLESNGAPEFNENGTLRYPLHGRIQNTPAYSVRLQIDAEKRELRLTGIMHEGRLFFNSLELESCLTLPFDGTGFRVDDTVRNLSARPAEFELLYHVNVGQPVADAGSRAEIPFQRIVPRCPWAAQNITSAPDYHAPVTGEPEMCFFYELAADENGNTKTMLRNPNGDFAMTLGFSVNEFPYFCQWKAQHAAEDGYVTGLEPCINFPNTRSFEQKNGRIAILKPGASRHFGLDFSFAVTKEEVETASAAVSALQAKCPDPIAVHAPIPEWCE